MRPHLLVALSPHGFGHAAMTAPVVNALRRRFPAMRVTLQTPLSRAMIDERYEHRPRLLSETPETVPVMRNAAEVDVEATAAAYRAEDARYGEIVAAEAAVLRREGVDFVLSNVSYVALDAARAAGIPSAALSCLNWADIYEQSCAAFAEGGILGRMRRAYNAAGAFLRVSPGMPMGWLENARDIAPVARPGRRRRQDLDDALGLDAGRKVGLVAFGGFDMPLRLADWPQHDGWCWLVPPRSCPERRDMRPWSCAGLPFPDLMASCDVIISKPGYGTFVEAAAAGVPILYLPRPDWPESRYLVEWLQVHGRCESIAEEDLAAGRLRPSLDRLMQGLPPSPVPTRGAEQAADFLAGMIAGGTHG